MTQPLPQTTPTTPTLQPAFTLIAAVARNGAIGRAGGLLWVETIDQRRFRELTMGHAVIMGRKTWDSLPPRFRPLPGRRNVVVSRQRGLQLQGAELAPSLADAISLLRTQAIPPAQVFVIGGGDLYALAMPLAATLELTEIDADLDGDTFFPPWPRDAFIESARQAHQAADGTRFDFVTYRRRPSTSR